MRNIYLLSFQVDLSGPRYLNCDVFRLIIESNIYWDSCSVKEQIMMIIDIQIVIDLNVVYNLKKMDAAMKKTFAVKVRALVRTLKEYKSYKIEVQAYDMNQVSQDKKKQEFYLESKSALDEVQKKLLEYYLQLKTYIAQNQAAIEEEEEPLIKNDYETANAQIQEVQSLLPSAC